MSKDKIAWEGHDVKTDTLAIAAYKTEQLGFIPLHRLCFQSSYASCTFVAFSAKEFFFAVETNS